MDEEAAKLHLQFAFVINSMFFMMNRIQGCEADIMSSDTSNDTQYNVMDQIQKIKQYFMKVDKEFHPEKYEVKKLKEIQPTHILYDKPIDRII